MTVICISGKAQNGKDTTANFLKAGLEGADKSVLIIHYGDLVKYICSSYFNWNGKKDEQGRSILQHVGTDVVRAKKPNYWVDFVIEFLKLFESQWDYVLIPDCRFPNEITAPQKNFHTLHVRVTRPNFSSPLTEEQQNHVSETALDNFPYDYLLVNDDSKAELGNKVLSFIKTILKRD